MEARDRIETIKLISNPSHAILYCIVKQIENPTIIMKFHESQNKILLPLNISIAGEQTFNCAIIISIYVSYYVNLQMIINIAQQSFLDHYFKILYTNIFIQIILIQT